MERIYSEIGARMRAMRRAQRRTQADVAEGAGIDPSFYGQVERGANIPSLKTFLAISKALNVDPAELLPGRPKQYQKTIETLISGLAPKKQRLLLDFVGDMATRLKGK